MLSYTDGHGVRPPLPLRPSFHLANPICSNKWVLNTTEAPLFFLLAQVIIAVGLFLASNALGVIKVPLEVDMQLIRGLTPMVALSVIGLRSVYPAYFPLPAC